MPKLDYTKTGERVRRFRKEKGWSQEELARKCGISQNFVGQIERGTRSMSLDTFARLCTVLEIGADSLLCENTEPSSYAMYVKIIQSAIFVTHRKVSREREWARFGGGFGRMFRNPWYSAGKSGVPRPDTATVYQQNT